MNTPFDPNVLYAAERTMLSWIRTGISLMGLGFVISRFGLFMKELAHMGKSADNPNPDFSLWIGTGLVVLSVVVIVTAGIQYKKHMREIERGLPHVFKKWTMGQIFSFVLGALGLVMAIHLINI